MSATIARVKRQAGVPRALRLWRSLCTLRYHEVRAHAILTSSALWVTAAILIFAGDGYRLATGSLKGADFVHFYTLGHQALHGTASGLFDSAVQRQKQVQLVPESATEYYIPVYPPQIAVLVAPLALLSYGWAAASWAALTSVLYGTVVWLTYRRSFAATPQEPVFVIAAAAAFPPLWQLVLHGQTTAVPLLSFFLGWLALERRRAFLGGLAFGLLAVKPQLGLALAVVVVARREWTLIAGAAVSVGIQAAAVALILGSGVLVDFAGSVQRLPDVARMLEPRAYQLYSLKPLADLLPSPAAMAAWVAISAAVLAGTVRLWSAGVPIPVRLGAVVMATVLVSPHLTIYDLTLLVLFFLWIGGWMERQARSRPVLRQSFWACTYVFSALLLVPIAAVIRLQPSVLLMLGLFALVMRAALGRESHADSAEAVHRPVLRANHNASATNRG